MGEQAVSGDVSGQGNGANGRRIALAFEIFTPPEACAIFSRALGRPVRYIPAPLEIKIPIPPGYRSQLEGIVTTLCEGRGEYFAPDMECPETAIDLWPGYRRLEDYAREIWPLEEREHGAPWVEGLSGAQTPALADDDRELAPPEQGLEFAA